LAALVGAIARGLGGGTQSGALTGKVAPEQPFDYQGQSYKLWVSQEGSVYKALVSLPGGKVVELTPDKFDPGIRPQSPQDLKKLLAAAQALAKAAPSRPQTGTNPLATVAQKQQAVTAAAAQVIRDVQADACTALNAAGGCFAAGMKLRTLDGWKTIETIEVGEWVLSRHEDDPYGEAAWKLVEQRFVRTGRILHVHVHGEVIRTTPEHPFYAFGKGWTAAGELAVGDYVHTLSGSWARVEEVFDTGCYETVYNLRVADYHTYFVGDEDWGFAAWAHNDYNGMLAVLAAAPELQGATVQALGQIRRLKDLGRPGFASTLTQDQFQARLETILREANVLPRGVALAPETVAAARALALVHGNTGRSPFRYIDPRADNNPYPPGSPPYRYFQRIAVLVNAGHPEAAVLTDLLPYGTRYRRFWGIPLQLWRTEYYAQQGLLRGVEVPVSGPGGIRGEVDILVAASPSDTEGTRLIDTKFWTQAMYPTEQANGMRRQLVEEVNKYLGANRVTASGQVIANGYTLTLEFPRRIPAQFRTTVAQLQNTYAGRLFVTENLGIPPR
jgi:hypothetical protein